MATTMMLQFAYGDAKAATTETSQFAYGDAKAATTVTSTVLKRRQS